MPDIQSSSSLSFSLMTEIGREIYNRLPAEAKADFHAAAENPAEWGQFSSTGNNEILSSHVRQAMFSAGGENPALAEAKLKTQMTMAEMAGNKASFHEFYKKVYGDRYDANIVENMRQQFLAGDFSALPEFKIVSGDTLQGNHAAYADGVVYLNENMLQNPDELVAYMIEESAHHFDTFFGPGDATGDEGELFRRMAGGENLSQDDINEIRNDNDKGTITVDGKQIDVEFGKLSKLRKKAKKHLKKVGKSLKKAFKKVVDLVKDFVKAVVDFAKLSVQVMIFPIDYAINGEEAVDRLEAAAKQALISMMQSELFQWVVTAVVTFFTAGTMTGPLLALMEGIKYGVMEGLKTLVVEYVKQKLLSMVTQEVAEKTGSETLGCIVGAVMSGNAGDLSNALQGGLTKLTSEQVVELAKDQVKEQMTRLVVKEIKEHVDFAPLQMLMTSWVQNGANFDNLNTTVNSLQKQMADTVSNMSWESMLDTAKDAAKDYAMDKISEKIGSAPTQAVFDWTTQGATLDRLPELLNSMQDSAKQELSQRVIEKVAKEVGPAPIRDALTQWVKDGADYKALPQLLGDLKNEYKEEMANLSFDDILKKSKQESETAVIAKIQENIRYKPVQAGLTEWIQSGANINDLSKVYDAVKADVDLKTDKLKETTDKASEKAIAVWEKVFSNNTTQKDVGAMRSLLDSINKAEKASASGSVSTAENAEKIKSELQDKFTNKIGSELQATLPEGAMKAALMQWVETGMNPQAFTNIPQQFAQNAAANESTQVDQDTLTKSLKHMGPAILQEIGGAMDLKAIESLMKEWPENDAKISNMLSKAEAISDKIPGGEAAKSQASTFRTVVLPEFSKTIGQSADYLKRLQEVLHQAENKASRMQNFQAYGGAA